MEEKKSGIDRAANPIILPAATAFIYNIQAAAVAGTKMKMRKIRELDVDSERTPIRSIRKYPFSVCVPPSDFDDMIDSHQIVSQSEQLWLYGECGNRIFLYTPSYCIVRCWQTRQSNRVYCTLYVWPIYSRIHSIHFIGLCHYAQH